MLSSFVLSLLAVSASLVASEPSYGAAPAIVERHGSFDVFGSAPKYQRMDRMHRPRGQIVNVDVSVSVHELILTAQHTIQPVITKIEIIVSDAASLAKDEIFDTLEGSFETIEGVLAGLAGDLAVLYQKTGKILLNVKHEISDEEIAKTLANLLNAVAAAINAVEDISDDFPVLGPLLANVYGKINGDLSSILSSIGNLLVGVVSLVKHLLQGLLEPVAGLPFLSGLLGGLLGGILSA